MQQLVELEKVSGKKPIEMFNFFGGTSIGGIMAILLACGTSAKEALNIFLECRPHMIGYVFFCNYCLAIYVWSQ